MIWQLDKSKVHSFYAIVSEMLYCDIDHLSQSSSPVISLQGTNPHVKPLLVCPAQNPKNIPQETDKGACNHRRSKVG